MTDDTPSFLSMLTALRSSYEELGIRATRLLSMVLDSTESFGNARAAALEESGVDAVIARATNGGEAVSEQEVRDFVVVHKEGFVQACKEMRVFKELDPERLWKADIRGTGVDKLLGIAS